MYNIKEKRPDVWDGTSFLGRTQIVVGSGAANTAVTYGTAFKTGTVPKVNATPVASGSSFAVWYLSACGPTGHTVAATGNAPYYYEAIGERAD